MNIKLKELFLLHFLNDGIRTTFIIMLPFIAKDLSLNYTQSGILGSTQPLIATFLAIPAGFLASKIGGYKMLTLLLIIYSLGSLSIGLSTNLILLIFAYLLGAAGFGMFHTTSFTMIAKLSDKTNIGRNMGDFTSFGEIGRVAIPPLAVFAVSFITWRGSMVSSAILGFLTFILFYFFVPAKDIYNLENNDTRKETHKDFARNIFKLLKSKKFGLAATGAIIDSFASSSIYIYFPFLVLTKGITYSQLGIITLGLFIGTLLGKTVLGRFSDTMGNAKVFIISEILMAACLIFATFFSNFFLLIFFSLLIGTFTKGTSPVIQTMFSQITHKDHYNKVYAVSEICIALSAAFAIVILGTVADKSGIVNAFYICAFFAILATIPIYFFSKISPSKFGETTVTAELE